MQISNKSIFKQYDIRGIVEKDFSRELIYSLARAYATYVSRDLGKNELKIAVGRDARLSGPELAKWFSEGLIDSGVEVIDLGMVLTPVVYFSMFELDVDGAIMITGSHNPPEYNGFKLGVRKTTIFGEDIQKLISLIENEDFIEGKGSISSYDILTDYINYQVKRHQSIKDSGRKLKVIIDAGNGTAGLAAPQIFSQLDCEVIKLFCEPDGNFPNHHPDPTIEKNLQHLIAAMKEHKADLGFSFDGDTDRIGLVDEKGNVLWGDEIMIILARDILSRHPAAKIIGEVKCSTKMYNEIEKAGGKPIMWRTGHSLIKNKMKEEKALLAGEMSGHIFFAEDYFGYDDALHAALEITNILISSKEHEKLSGFLADLPEMVVTPEIRIDCDEAKKFKIVEKVIEMVKAHKETGNQPLINELNLIDGIRVEFENGWGLVRASNTQPILVSRFEADSTENLNAYKAFIEKVVKSAGEA